MQQAFNIGPCNCCGCHCDHVPTQIWFGLAMCGNPLSVSFFPLTFDPLASSDCVHTWREGSPAVYSVTVRCDRVANELVIDVLTAGCGFASSCRFHLVTPGCELFCTPELLAIPRSSGVCQAGDYFIIMTSPGGEAAAIPLPPAAPTIVGDPLFSPPAGTYAQPFALSIVSATPGAMIHFTTNGTEPTESSPTYSSAIGVLGDATIKARAYKSGLDPSATVSASYTIGQPPPAGNAWDIELQGIGIGANQCGNCTMLNSIFLATGVYLDSGEPTLLVLDVPPDCGEGRYLRWVVDFTPGQPIRVELRLGWFLSAGAVEYLLAVYSSGQSSSNWLTSHEAVLPVVATYYDPHLSCSLSGTSVRLRSFAY